VRGRQHLIRRRWFATGIRFEVDQALGKWTGNLN